MWFLVLVIITFSISCDTNNGQLGSGDIVLPSGFSISLYANVPNARSLALSENGILFVGNRSSDKVYAVIDNNNDFIIDEVITVASGLNQPNGVAIKDGNLFVAEINRVLMYADIESNFRDNPTPAIVRDDLPTKTHHGWKFIRFGPDGKLYVPVGAPCNVCLEDDPRFASITRMNPDGSGFEIFASGVRNTVGFDWHPGTGELWFTDNGRDLLGDDIPPDELNHAPEQGLHFGFPFWHGSNIPDPQFGSGHTASEFTLPAQELGPHVASLGMRFYTGNMFPPEYRNQIFIAEHGSWNRSEKIGYRITLVRLENNEPVSYEVFAEGWLIGESVSGRPVDIEQMPDGSLLISDDFAGKIYRISYSQ
ncbi:MAG: sorbosone dehydrogenase family protein [Ignavibacteria bacterium]